MDTTQVNATASATRIGQWIEIDTASYKQNLSALKSQLAPTTKVMAVVKANAYGHGARIITRHALEWGADYLGVHSIEEYAEIADLVSGIPVCLLGPILPGDAARVVGSGVEPTVSEIEAAEALEREAAKAGIRVRLHLKVETGTHRQGIRLEEIPRWAELFRNSPHLLFHGLHSHFANIEDTTDHTFARSQVRRFEEGLERFSALGLRPTLRHMACSAAVMVMPEVQMDMARLGIAGYGLWPSRETRVSMRHASQEPLVLKPVLSWRTRIGQVKPVDEGEYIGYGCTVRATRRLRVAVLPVGYYDGYDRRLSNRGYVLVHGRRAPVIGRVCMNLTMVDVTDIPEARPGSVATLIGRDGQEEIGAEDLAALCGTIGYEIVARLGRHIPRIEVEANRQAAATA